jgi:uncharacterized protein
MKIAITGSTGFIGSRLSAYFESLKWTVIPITRDDLSRSDDELSAMIEGTDVIINLAGAPIIARHTSALKKEIYDSRINTTHKLVNAIKISSKPPLQFISGSAVGIYSEKTINTEVSYEYASDFSAVVVNDWEEAARQVEKYSSLTIVRLGIVLDGKEGALPTMAKPFKMGVGGKIGSGAQMFSWIHIEDLIKAFHFLIEGRKSGIYNLTSPGYLRNSDFTQVLAKTLNKPAVFTVPEFALKLIYGDGAKTLTSGQAVYPERLINEGFVFKYPVIEKALNDLLS